MYINLLTSASNAINQPYNIAERKFSLDSKDRAVDISCFTATERFCCMKVVRRPVFKINCVWKTWQIKNTTGL